MALVLLMLDRTWAWAPLFWFPHPRHTMPEDMVPLRRTMRSRFAEQCVRRWVQHAQWRGQLFLDHEPELVAFKPHCESCADVIQVRSGKVAIMDPKKKEPVLQFESLEAEVSDFPRRVLNGGSTQIRAIVSCSAADLDRSRLWHSLVGRMLGLQHFETTVDPEFGVKVSSTRVDDYYVALQPTTNDGVLSFRSLDVKVPSRNFPWAFVASFLSLYVQQLQVNPGFTLNNIAISGNRLVADVLTQPPRPPAPSLINSLFKLNIDVAHRMPWLLSGAAAPRVVVLAFTALAVALHITSFPDLVFAFFASVPTWLMSFARAILGAIKAFSFGIFKAFLTLGRRPVAHIAGYDMRFRRRRIRWWARTRRAAATLAGNCWRNLMNIAAPRAVV